MSRWPRTIPFDLRYILERLREYRSALSFQDDWGQSSSGRTSTASNHLIMCCRPERNYADRSDTFRSVGPGFFSFVKNQKRYKQSSDQQHVTDCRNTKYKIAADHQ